ncbi:MAG: glycine betaine ABC transporter substrate-binding protein [Ilumatobacteraceae bacterium]
MRRSKMVVAALVAASALFAAACGGGDEGGDASGGGTETIKIVRNNWTASLIEAEILKQLIEQNLGNPVEVLDIDENAMFAGMSSGEVDVNLEVWPSGVTPDEQAFIDDGSVSNMGELGAIGKIGWFMPQYVVDKYPELATWEGLKDPAIAKAFATAATGDNGRFLGMDPSFSQYDEAIIKNLALPFQVQFSGSEAATMAEIEARSANQEPLIMYYWTPTAAVGKYNLVNVSLPAPSVDCAAEGDKCDGDYPEDVLFKIASTKLKDKDGKVWTLVQNFKLTTQDQLGLLPKLELDKRDPVEVAAEWIKDNESVWKAWLG